MHYMLDNEIFPGIDNGKLITPDRVREKYVTYTTKPIKPKINVKCKSIIQFIILEQLKNPIRICFKRL